jgi:hypothetical protein
LELNKAAYDSKDKQDGLLCLGLTQKELYILEANSSGLARRLNFQNCELIFE